MKYQIKFSVYILDVCISGACKYIWYMCSVFCWGKFHPILHGLGCVSLFSLCHFLSSSSTSTSQGEVTAPSMSWACKKETQMCCLDAVFEEQLGSFPGKCPPHSLAVASRFPKGNQLCKTTTS